MKFNVSLKNRAIPGIKIISKKDVTFFVTNQLMK